jgi:hypothetical protein
MAKMQRSGQEDPPRRGSDAIEPPDPNDRLKQLQSELDQHNARIEHLTKQRDALQTDITDLSATVAAVKTTVTNYGSNHKDLEARLHALRYFYDQKSKMVHAAIGDKKDLIDDLVHDFDHETGKMEERLLELAGTQAAALAESHEAGNTEVDRQKEYDAKNQYQAKVTAQLTDMETLRNEITHADDTTDVASMYFLLLEFRDDLSETHVISQHQLSLELRERLGDLEAAKERARAKAAALSSVQVEYAAHKAALDARTAGRRGKLLAEVEAKCPVPPAPSQSAAGTASATPSGATPTGATPAGATPTGVSSPVTGAAGTSSLTPTPKK